MAEAIIFLISLQAQKIRAREEVKRGVDKGHKIINYEIGVGDVPDLIEGEEDI